MDLVKMTCGSCGGPLEVQEDVKFVTCGFCGSQLEVHVNETARWSEVRKVVEEHSAYIEQLKLQDELKRVDQQWKETRKSFRGPFNGLQPQASGQIGLFVLALVFAISTTCIATGWMIKTHSTRTPSAQDIAEHRKSKSRIDFESNSNSLERIPKILSPDPRERRDEILRERETSKRFVFASFVVYMLPAMAYALHREEMERFKGFSAAKEQYLSCRAEIESAIRRLTSDIASRDSSSAQTPPPLHE
ncbi:MAG: hypothetical protein KDA88_19280 [Planctomycetaceae bacterium]|nr:hypothetical protein [Planctomycetaceae bacterium]MCB9954252.1 hypothetical protein [Planctomycetaceae bacterium]